ncbi:unnamed protein product, partial [Aureobasidium pullulans]
GRTIIVPYTNIHNLRLDGDLDLSEAIAEEFVRLAHTSYNTYALAYYADTDDDPNYVYRVIAGASNEDPKLVNLIAIS